MLQEITTASEEETSAFAARFAMSLPERGIVFLEGDLGAGKSVFARALIRTLSGNQVLDVPSPTFTLLQTYETPKGPVWHYDLYRLKDPQEMEELSWDDALSNGLVLIEWPDRLKHLKPRGMGVKIETVQNNPNARKIRISDET